MDTPAEARGRPNCFRRAKKQKSLWILNLIFRYSFSTGCASSAAPPSSGCCRTTGRAVSVSRRCKARAVSSCSGNSVCRLPHSIRWYSLPAAAFLRAPTPYSKRPGNWARLGRGCTPCTGRPEACAMPCMIGLPGAATAGSGAAKPAGCRAPNGKTVFYKTLICRPNNACFLRKARTFTQNLQQ